MISVRTATVGPFCSWKPRLAVPVASRMAMKGWTITEIAQQGGWKELRVLKRYTHLKPEYLADKLKQR